MGSAMLMGSLGIDTDNSNKNSLAYLTGWLSVIKNDIHFVVQASAKAQKACDLIMGVEFKEEEQTGDEIASTKQQ
jgi:antirestriction protein ArdC